ncbi:MAG: oligosaccharide flippase family protein, partial [Ignavibacteriales bacterium]|nr:oligosaccharide flippase family protein [Ignavibacteriales bacterium]
MRKQFFMSSLSGVIQIVVNSILAAVTIPLFINKLGLQSYGVFALISVVSYFNVLGSLGINTSLVKHLAEQGRSRESNFDIVAAFLMISIVVFPLAVIAMLYSDALITNLFQVPHLLVTSATRQCFVFLVLSNVLVLLGQIPSAILDALQVVYWTNGIQ